MKYLLLFVLFVACNSGRSLKNNSLFVGNWCLVKGSEESEFNYGGIMIKSNTALVLTSRADTIYHYGYVVKEDVLQIIVGVSDTVNNPIIKLTSDSLILMSLMEKHSVQKYYRCH
jgi:hypothetical protein